MDFDNSKKNLEIYNNGIQYKNITFKATSLHAVYSHKI